MRSLAPATLRNVRVALFAPLMVTALLWFSPAADAQDFGVVDGPNVFQDGWIAQVFADDARLVTDAYSNTANTPDAKHDPYPDPSTDGTGIYELAGGHPYIGVTDFTMKRTSPDGPPAGGNVGRVRVDVPKGLMPNPGQFARCTDQQLKDIACPRASQIGTQEMVVYISALAPLTGDITLKVPLYNMTPLSNPEDPPQRQIPARFGFNPAEAAETVAPTDPLPNPLAPLLEALAGLHPVHIVGGVRDAVDPVYGPSDYGLYFTIDHLPEYDSSSPSSPGVIRSNLTFWGVPGDKAAHDDERGVACVLFEDDAPVGFVEPGCTAFAPPATPANPDPDPKTPFLNNPTHCTGTDQITRLSVWTHANLANPPTDQIDEPTPGVVDKNDGIEKHGAQGCLENVPFDGGVAVDPQATAADSPSGPRVSITVPQDGLTDKAKFATSHVKDVSVTLPPGLTINPSVANGLEACTDEQFVTNTGVVGGDACPDASQIGTATAESPLLPSATSHAAGDTDPLIGPAYVGQPIPGNKYRLFLALEGREISIRLKGSVSLNAKTGQVTATFQNNPELPFTDLSVDFEDGSRSPLATPLDCGPKVASATLTPWSGTAPISPSSDPFQMTGGCPVGFAPGFGAKSDNPSAGAKAPLRVTITRPDGNQFLSSARVVTPPGFAGVIKGIPKCADAQANAGACPAASRIGTAVTRAGAGDEPFQLSGPVYLTEGYKGGALGMVVVVRAIAGPYDLGTVVVRQAIFVDPEDAHLTVVSDPLPQILDGVPIRLRQASINLDRPGFAYNPTSCGAKQFDSTLYPAVGSAVNRSASVGIGNCGALGFSPKMTMQLIGPRQTRFEGHPSLKTVVKSPSGQANIGRVRVVLPKALALDPRNSQKVCSVADAAKADCPASTRIGFAKAVSPALNDPLTGPAYFVQGIRTDPNTGAQIRTLPSLLVKLRGEIGVNLRGVTAVERNHLVSTFERIPDAPVSEFALKLRGGKRGPLVVSARRGICDREQITNAQMAGQNGKAHVQKVDMVKPCRRPMIRFKRIRPSESRLVVKGTMRRKASKPLKATFRCGGKRVVKRAKRRGTRWAVAFKRTGRCGDVRKSKLRVSYPGGGDFRIAVRKRNVKLPAGS